MESIPSGDKWWMMQISKGLRSHKQSNGCHVAGFWLELLPSTEQPQTGCALRLHRDNNNTFYGSLTKENGRPVEIPIEKLNTGWRQGAVVYNISEEFVQYLDKVSDDHRSALARIAEPTDDSSSDDTEVEDEELSHVIQQEVLQSRRTRIFRDTAGQRISSYAELSGQRQRTRQVRRSEMLTLRLMNLQVATKILLSDTTNCFFLLISDNSFPI